MSDDLRALDARVRWDLRWHDVTAQQRALADLLLDLTFACGAESVHVARLDDLGRLLGTGRSHVSEFVKQLTGMAIIRVDGTKYRVRPRSSLHEWKVAWRKDAEAVQRWLSEMRQANGAQQEWWREEKTIAQTVAEAEARVPVLGTPGYLNEVRAALASPDVPVSGTCVPETGTSGQPLIDRSIRVLEKKIGTDRVEESIDFSRLEGTDRGYLLKKLSRMHRLQQEILKPQNGDQRRMARLFWQAEEQDVEWLKGVLADLADRTDVANKAAWLNRTLTKWATVSSQAKGNGIGDAQYLERGRLLAAPTAAIGIRTGPSGDKSFG